MAGSGARGVTWGGGAVTNMTTPQIRDISKEIETEDQRQQALNRTLLANKRAYAELELIKDVNQFVRDIDKLKLQGNIKAAQDLFEAKVQKALANNNIRGAIAVFNAAKQSGLAISDAMRSAVVSTYGNYGYTRDNDILLRTLGSMDLPGTSNPYQERPALKTEDREGGMYVAGQENKVNPAGNFSAVGSSSAR